jgi:hypothetical protein
MADSKRVGRPIETDRAADEALFDEWLAARSQGVSRVDFAKARDLTLRELEKAIDRHRGRMKVAGGESSHSR